jgi:hypothetical protein
MEYSHLSGESPLPGNKTLTTWGVRLAALAVLLLVGYAGYRIMIIHPITHDPNRAYDFSQFYISERSVYSAAKFVVILAAGCFLCIKVLRNNWFILFVPAAMILGAGQAGALAGFLIQATAGLVVGIPIYRKMRSREMPNEASFSGIIMSWFLGGSINAYIVWIALHWKVNYSYVYFFFFLGEIFLLRRQLLDIVVESAKKIKSYRFTSGQWTIALWAIFMLPYALVPLFVGDDYIRHVFFPKQVALFGRHVFDPAVIWSIDTEVFSQSYYTIGYLLGGEYVLRLLTLAAAIGAMLLLEDYCRRTFGICAAFFTALVLVGTPFVGIYISFIYLESFNFLSVTVMMIVMLYGIEKLDRNTVALTCVLAAVAFLYKQQAVFLALPAIAILAAALAVLSIKKRSYWPMLWMAGGILAAIIVVAPFLVQNYILTKNPFFPWFNGIFRSEMLMPISFKGHRFTEPLSFGSLIDLTFNGERFVEIGPFLFGVYFFALAWFMPFVFADRKKRLVKVIILGLFAASIPLWWKITSPNMRYFIGPLAAGSILLGLTMDVLWRWIRRDGLAKVLAITALAGAMLINTASMLNSYDRFCTYPLTEAFSKQFDKCGPCLPAIEEYKKVFSASCAKFGKEASCLLISPPTLCLADQRVEMLDWTYCRNLSAMKAWRNEEDAFDWIFRQRKFACMITCKDCYIPLLASERFQEKMNIEFANGGVLLLSPKTSEMDKAAKK